MTQARRIREIHRRFGAPGELVARRRALYSAVLEAVAGGPPEETADLLDSPLLRHRVGEVLAGRAAAVTPVDDRRQLLSEISAAPSADVPPIVTDPQALHDALEVVRQGLGAGVPALRPVVPGDPRFAGAGDAVADGIRLARRLCPELVDDIVPHVALVAVVAGSPRLGSASAREYPGLVVVPEPETPFEVAEALVHEGAHQKLFDLGVTCALVQASTFDAPGIAPSWHDGVGWPLEQALAACHAYRCLAALATAVTEAREPVTLHGHSLLRDAGARADELGAALDRHRDRLGPDGRLLVDLLNGYDAAREPSVAPPLPAAGTAAVTRDCGDRRLLVHRSDPITLVWEPVPAG